MEKTTKTEYKVTKEDLLRMITGKDQIPVNYELFWERPGSQFPVRLVITHSDEPEDASEALEKLTPNITDGMTVMRNPDSASAPWVESCRKAGLDPYGDMVVQHRSRTSLVFKGLEGMWPAIYFSPVEDLGGFAGCCESDPLPEPDHVEQVFSNDLISEPFLIPMPANQPIELKTLDEAIADNPAPIIRPVIVRKSGAYSETWMNFCKAKGVPIASRLLVQKIKDGNEVAVKIDPYFWWDLNDFVFVEGSETALASVEPTPGSRDF